MMTEEILRTLTQVLEKQSALMEMQMAAIETGAAPKNDYFKGAVERTQAPPHIKQLLGLTKEKAAANFQTATPLHGTGGIFSTPGIDRTVVTAYVRSGPSLASMLAKVPSVDESPRFATLTGYTATTGSEPTNACEDAPTGYVKGCNLTARFGMIRRDTNTIEMDKVMLKLNRSDFKDLVLAGEVLGLTDLVPSGLNQAQILNVVTMSEMVIAGVNAERKFVADIWQGTVAAGTFPGLDVQITTGHIDADTGTACPAVDSDVKSFNYNNVDNTGTLDIVEYLSMIEYYLYNNAEKMGLLPVNWVIVMRPQLWHELSAVWPIVYHTDRSASIPAAGVTLFLNGAETVAQRDSMRREMKLAINGREYEVVTDSGIFEHNNINNGNLGAGEFASSIYFVPLTIGGNIPATYIEYVDYRQSQPDTAQLAQFPGAPDYFWTDNGMYSWSVDQNRWCYQLSLKVEPRVVLRTPHLAGRLDYVRYIPLQHLRESDPTSPYNADGGVSFRTPTAAQAVWA